jgi:apolipoprotein N-acyltransferase
LTFTAVRKAADPIILSSGWGRRAIAFLAGACGALAMAPIDFFPAMLIPMTVAVWLIDGASSNARRSETGAFLSVVLDAAGAGWWLGFGYFVAGLWWIGAALLVDADEFAWALPIAVFGLPAVLAIFTAVGFALARAVWSSGAGRLLALAFGLGASEWLRGFVATGFPWNDFGMALGGNLVLAQSASAIGLQGLTFVAIILFASPALLVDERNTSKGRFSRFAYAPTLCLFGFAALGLFGALRLSAGHVDDVSGVQLRVMQPNIEQGPYFRPENKTAIMDRYLALSDRATSPQTTGVADVTHLIWPESAFPFILSRDAEALGRITAFLGPKTILLTGAARQGEPDRASRLPGETRRAYYNSVQAIDREHGVFASYDKVHLVPFGEYLPLGALLERFGIRRLVSLPGGFEPGGARKYMTVPGLPVLSALVCYEAVFSGEVTLHDDARERPGLLLNVSEDGWYGRTAGPYQHFSQARLRSIEEGLPLVRAANTGISAIVDPYGRVVKSLPVGVEAVIDGRLPKAIPATIFSRWPLVGPLLLLFLALAGALIGRWREA